METGVPFLFDDRDQENAFHVMWYGDSWIVKYQRADGSIEQAELTRWPHAVSWMLTRGAVISYAASDVIAALDARLSLYEKGRLG